MPKLDLPRIPVRTGTIYRPPYDAYVAGRSSQRLGEAGGLTQFGANLVTLQPGAKSSLRHWHLHEDEFVMVTKGECTLVQDGGPVLMQTGDCAAFPAGDPDGHQFINHTNAIAEFLVIGTRAPFEVATYSDVDLRVELTPGEHGTARFTYKDGNDWEGLR